MTTKDTEVRRSLADAAVDDRTDWDRIRSLTDAQIAAAVAGDPDAAPIFTAEMMARAAQSLPAKEQITLRIDADVLKFFRDQGLRYQTRINAVLRAYMDHAKRSK